MARVDDKTRVRVHQSSPGTSRRSVPKTSLRVEYEGHSMRSLGLDLAGTLDVVHETGPWYEAGSGPTSSSRFSSYPFMFQPTCQALVDEYNDFVAQDVCNPTRFSMETALKLEESIDMKLASLEKFDFSLHLLAELDAEEREYKISLRHFTRSEEQERLARHNEDAAYRNHQLLMDSQSRRDRKSMVSEQEWDAFESRSVVFDSTESIFEQDCDRDDCPICTGMENLVLPTGDKVQRKIPMPLYRRVESIDVIGDDSTDRLSAVHAETLHKARTTISKLRQLRNSMNFIVGFPENSVTTLRREVWSALRCSLVENFVMDREREDEEQRCAWNHFWEGWLEMD